MGFPPEVEIEENPCPLGCAPGDDKVLTGRDRLHDLPGEFTLVRCRTCRLMRTNPRPTQRTIGFYYPEDYGPYQNTQVVLTPSRETRDRLWKRIMRRVFDTETKKIPPLQPGRMLEIGCASGSFLHQMAGRRWQVEGLELSKKAADAARALGIQVHCGALETAPEPTKPYDLVVGWHVFEHLHDPIRALQRLQRWTESGGYLVISLPDASALEFKIFKNRWYALQIPTHLFHYTPGTLRNVLSQGGWRVERVFWHNNPNNLLESLRYRCMDCGWNKLGDYLLDIVQGRRHRCFRVLMGKVLGTLHASGRMTIWARRI